MIKLVSVNIERDNHHDTVIPFLKKEAPDVICIQELLKEDLEMYEKELGMHSFFKPMCYFKASDYNESKIFGLVMFSKNIFKGESKYIVGNENDIPQFKKAENRHIERNKVNILLEWAELKNSAGECYRIATTHFTWAPDGLSTEYQREDARKLIDILENEVKDFVLVGDLNSPRGKETFAMFAEKFTDNIPKEHDSSIDPNLHRMPGLKLMVDGLFTTPKYVVREIRLVEGVSDHKAIVASIDYN